jgi:hypothetical protein
MIPAVLAIPDGVQKIAPRAKSAAKTAVRVPAPALIRLPFRWAIIKLDYPILMI